MYTSRHKTFQNSMRNSSYIYNTYNQIVPLKKNHEKCCNQFYNKKMDEPTHFFEKIHIFIVQFFDRFWIL